MAAESDKDQRAQALERLIEFVRQWYRGERQQRPLLLSTVGIDVLRLDPPLRLDAFKSIRQAVLAADDSLRLVNHPNIRAMVAVALPENEADVLSWLIAMGGKSGPDELDGLPRPLLLAFCVETHGAPIYVSTRRPIRYHRGRPESSVDHWIQVDAQYRVPGVSLEQMSARDRQRLRDGVNGWLKAHGISRDALMAEGQKRKPSNALERLLDAQVDDELRKRILIPGDIVKLLSSTP